MIFGLSVFSSMFHYSQLLHFLKHHRSNVEKEVYIKAIDKYHLINGSIRRMRETRDPQSTNTVLVALELKVNGTQRISVTQPLRRAAELNIVFHFITLLEVRLSGLLYDIRSTANF